jgi:hypothetical protein
MTALTAMSAATAVMSAAAMETTAVKSATVEPMMEPVIPEPPESESDPYADR